MFLVIFLFSGFSYPQPTGVCRTLVPWEPVRAGRGWQPDCFKHAGLPAGLLPAAQAAMMKKNILTVKIPFRAL